MTMTKVNAGAVTYAGPKTLKIGQTVEGIYLGLTEKDQFGKENYRVESADGNLTIINRSGQLAYLMNRVPVGAHIAVTYKGKQLIASGKSKGREAHQWDVAYEAAANNAPAAAKVANGSVSKLPF